MKSTKWGSLEVIVKILRLKLLQPFKLCGTLLRKGLVVGNTKDKFVPAKLACTSTNVVANVRIELGQKNISKWMNGPFS